METATIDPLELFVDTLVHAARRGEHELLIGYAAHQFTPEEALEHVREHNETYSQGATPFLVFLKKGDHVQRIGNLTFTVGYGRTNHSATYTGKKPSDPQNTTQVNIRVTGSPTAQTPYLVIDEDGIETYTTTRRREDRFGRDPIRKEPSFEEHLKHITALEERL